MLIYDVILQCKITPPPTLLRKATFPGGEGMGASPENTGFQCITPTEGKYRISHLSPVCHRLAISSTRLFQLSPSYS